MKLLVFGSQGQVGWELMRTLLPLGEVVGLTRADADLASPDIIRHAIEAYRPQVIINAAAYTAVDKAESEPDLACAINAHAPGVMAEVARQQGALLIHYSTDYVFDGVLDRPYLETDPPNPLSIYGKSKLAGEESIAEAGGDYLILRTSWVYGNRGHNFLKTIQRLAHERETLRIVADQIGAPTWSRWIAEATAHIVRESLKRRHSGDFNARIYHLTASGAVSWHGFAKAIVDRLSHPRCQEINAIATPEYPLPAPRPCNSRLNCDDLMRDYAIAGVDWLRALDLCLQT
jgi:dTDP-4-dehydrorhamnose reductase